MHVLRTVVATVLGMIYESTASLAPSLCAYIIAMLVT